MWGIYSQSHFIDEKTEAQKAEIIFPKWYTIKWRVDIWVYIRFPPQNHVSDISLYYLWKDKFSNDLRNLFLFVYQNTSKRVL